MTIDEAIRVNTVLLGAPILRNDQKVVEALHLSIEALSYIKLLRQTDPKDVPALFYGETEK